MVLSFSNQSYQRKIQLFMNFVQMITILDMKEMTVRNIRERVVSHSIENRDYQEESQW